jgi:ABC-type multidrug transport system fused ATPase/permease subunit
LFGGFVYQMWQADGIRWRTLVELTLDQLANVYIYIKLTVSVYMVDCVFNMDDESLPKLFIPGNRLATCWVVAMLILCPMFILYAADLVKIKMDIQGRLQRDLSQNLFRKFMNYNKQSREEVPTPDCVVALTQDCGAVTAGYINCLKMCQLAGKLSISIFFTLSQNPSAWWACLLVPSLMILWGYKRTNAYIRASSEKGDTESAVCAFVNEAMNKIPVIADYNQRPQINELFAGKSEDLRQMQMPENFVIKNNMFFPHLLGPALVALYTAVGGSMVLEGEMNLGVYLATISVFGEICSAFADFFHQVMNIIGTFAPLVGITGILNKPTDVPAWKAVNRKRRALTKEFRGEILQTLKDRPPPEGEPFVPAADRLEIKLVDMVFGHPGKNLIFQNLTFSCKQGSICAIIGEPGKGRRSLLELIAHKMFPDDGTLFIPSHLRVLYVSSDSVLLNLSLWKNLTFGNSKGNDPFRVEKILKALRMDEALEMCATDLSARKRECGHASAAEEEAEEEEPQQKGSNPLDKLRQSQKANIHIARALIMNPEVMVLHRPFMHYPKAGDDDTSELIREILRQHRDNRGFQMNPDDAYKRRPRTCFFTPDTRWEAQTADFCWKLPKQVGGPCIADEPSVAWPENPGRDAGTSHYDPQSLREAARKLDIARKHEADKERSIASMPQRPENLMAQRATDTLASSPLPALPGPDPGDPQRAVDPDGMLQKIQELRQNSRPKTVSPDSLPEPYAAPERVSEPISVNQDRYESPLRQPGMLRKEDRILPPSQSTLLKQELMALGPRPMTQLEGMGESLRDTHDNFSTDLGPRVAPGLYGDPSATPSYNSANPLLRPPGYSDMSTNMEHPQMMVERKSDQSQFNRRCCGP